MRNGGIGGKVVEGILRNFNGSNTFEAARHGEGKQSHSGEQIECGAAAAICRDQLDQLGGKKAVGLEKRSRRDPVAVAAHVVDQARGASRYGTPARLRRRELSILPSSRSPSAAPAANTATPVICGIRSRISLANFASSTGVVA